MGDQQLPVVRLSPALRAIVESAAVAVGDGTFIQLKHLHNHRAPVGKDLVTITPVNLDPINIA